MEWSSNGAVALNEATVISSKAKKTFKIMLVLWDWK